MVLILKINALYAFLGWWLKALGILGTVVILATIAVLASDRAAPFIVLETEPVIARACEKVAFRSIVWRDQSRECSAALSRSFVDARGERHDLGSFSFTAKALAELENETPGVSSPKIALPCDAPPGDSALITSRFYSCNRVHSWGWPIEVTTSHPVTILPP